MVRQGQVYIPDVFRDIVGYLEEGVSANQDPRNGAGWQRTQGVRHAVWGITLYAVRGWRLHNFEITVGARQDDGSHRGGLPTLRPDRVWEEDKRRCTCLHRRRWCESKRPGKPTNRCNPSTYLEGAGAEAPDMPTDIARRTRACRMRIRRFQRERYDQPKVALSLKTRMVKVEEIEALLCGCSTWTLPQEHYLKLRTVHYWVLLQIIGTIVWPRTTAPSK